MIVIKRKLLIITSAFLMLLSFNYKKSPQGLNIDEDTLRKLEEDVQVEINDVVKIDEVEDLKLIYDGSCNLSELGDYLFSYSFIDEDQNHINFKKNVKVVDTTPPVISKVEDITIEKGVSFSLMDINVDISDNSKKEITKTFETELDTEIEGSYPVILKAYDLSNNESSINFNVIVEDIPEEVIEVVHNQNKTVPNKENSAPVSKNDQVVNTPPKEESKPELSIEELTQQGWDIINSMPNILKNNVASFSHGAPLDFSPGSNMYAQGNNIYWVYRISEKTLYHEAGHTWFHTNRVLLGQKHPELKELYEKEWEGKGYYGSSHISEAIAETVEDIFMSTGKASHAPGFKNLISKFMSGEYHSLTKH